ncbi:hypothetical protein CASFOL_008762 [Castilleja foliolosa]|uniref:DNA-directed RNA polymerase subunit n=1 Tax=Castilleja foliolosa TaxID=1961234 RepID=A0ABD3E3Y8_9LAMI
MFFLSEIEHALMLPPHLLNLPIDDAIKGELDSLFLDKVIGELGLCVSVYDIRSIEGGFVFPNDGASTYTVKFRLVMFRPFVGEVISAKLKESTKDGLRLSIGFFDDIYVPVPLLTSPNHSEPNPAYKLCLDGVVWYWEYDGANYPIDGEDEIRFRVHNISYPPIPLDQDIVSGENDSQQKESKPFAPMVVTGALDDDGLGPISWWV